MNAPIETAVAVETVQKAVTTASLLNHLRNNRIEYLLCVGLAHLLGLTERLWTSASGVC